MGLTVTNLDSKESAFFARETEFVKSRTYDAKTPALKGLALVPQATDLPEGISEVTYRRYSEAGEAKVIANYAKDFLVLMFSVKKIPLRSSTSVTATATTSRKSAKVHAPENASTRDALLLQETLSKAS